MGTKELLSWQVPRSAETIAEFREAAESGDAYAQTEYGKCILFRKGTPEDIADAYHWFEKAAAQSNEVAKMYVGHCKLYGIGVEEQKENGNTMLDDALNYNYPGSGSSQSQAEYSQFEEEDLCQLFWDLGYALENGKRLTDLNSGEQRKVCDELCAAPLRFYGNYFVFRN